MEKKTSHQIPLLKLVMYKLAALNRPISIQELVEHAGVPPQRVESFKMNLTQLMEDGVNRGFIKKNRSGKYYSRIYTEEDMKKYEKTADYRGRRALAIHNHISHVMSNIYKKLIKKLLNRGN